MGATNTSLVLQPKPQLGTGTCRGHSLTESTLPTPSDPHHPARTPGQGVQANPEERQFQEPSPCPPPQVALRVSLSPGPRTGASTRVGTEPVSFRAALSTASPPPRQLTAPLPSAPPDHGAPATGTLGSHCPRQRGASAGLPTLPTCPPRAPAAPPGVRIPRSPRWRCLLTRGTAVWELSRGAGSQLKQRGGGGKGGSRRGRG